MKQNGLNFIYVEQRKNETAIIQKEKSNKKVFRLYFLNVRHQM
jgi:hypothetical protein